MPRLGSRVRIPFPAQNQKPSETREAFFDRSNLAASTKPANKRSRNRLSMKIIFTVIGKTNAAYLETGINEYIKRLKHYVNFSYQVIPELKNTKKLSENQQKEQEGQLVLSKVQKSEVLVLLDENGQQFRSEGFAKFIEKKALAGTNTLRFVIGGPYGFSAALYKAATHKISLSPMTFSHQMVRLIFSEQLYRAFTILKGEPYHHK